MSQVEAIAKFQKFIEELQKKRREREEGQLFALANGYPDGDEPQELSPTNIDVGWDWEKCDNSEPPKKDTSRTPPHLTPSASGRLIDGSPGSSHDTESTLSMTGLDLPVSPERGDHNDP